MDKVSSLGFLTETSKTHSLLEARITLMISEANLLAVIGSLQMNEKIFPL